MSKFYIAKRADSARERNGIGTSLDKARATPLEVCATQTARATPRPPHWHGCIDVQQKLEVAGTDTPICSTAFRREPLQAANCLKNMLHFGHSVPFRQNALLHFGHSVPAVRKKCCTSRYLCHLARRMPLVPSPARLSARAPHRSPIWPF